MEIGTMRAAVALAGLALISGAAGAQAAGDPPYVVKERGEGYGSLQEAVDAIGGGTGTILIAPGVHRQCAVQKDGRIVYQAAEPGTAVFDGVACDGKAALVLDGRSASVVGLVFQNIRVADRNGAGIRLQKGDLSVSETMFRDSENGILSGEDPASTVRVDRSTFSGLGGCDDGYGCAHSLYIGGYGRLTVTRSRFERGTGGHYVKTRTPRVDITDSSFDDSQGRATNYMIDLSNGATGTIARNTFVQGEDKENYSALIMVAAEGQDNRSAGLTIASNDASIAPGVDRKTNFVADKSGDEIRIEDNRLGSGIARLERR